MTMFNSTWTPAPTKIVIPSVGACHARTNFHKPALTPWNPTGLRKNTPMLSYGSSIYVWLPIGHPWYYPFVNNYHGLSHVANVLSNRWHPLLGAVSLCKRCRHIAQKSMMVGWYRKIISSEINGEYAYLNNLSNMMINGGWLPVKAGCLVDTSSFLWGIRLNLELVPLLHCCGQSSRCLKELRWMCVWLGW